MSAEVFDVSEDELKAFPEIANELEASPSQSSSSGGSSIVPSPPPGLDIPAMRKQLAVLVSRGKTKEAIWVQLTH